MNLFKNINLKAKISVLVFSIVSLNIFCQDTSVKILYGVVSEGKQEFNTNKLFKNADALLNTMEMHLEANSSKAKYWGENKMPEDINQYTYRISKVMIDSDRQYFYDLENNTITCWFNIFDKAIILKNSIDEIKWALSNESKQIGDYTCYKAKTSYPIISKKGDKITKNIVAWYCPQIPYYFGPRGFCGLPGLILELKDDHITYYPKKINFYKENNLDYKIPKGNFMTKDELKTYVEEASKSKWGN